MINNSEALLSSDGRFTIFSFGNHVIRFKAPYSLEKYTEIKEFLKPIKKVRLTYD